MFNTEGKMNENPENIKICNQIMVLKIFRCVVFVVFNHSFRWRFLSELMTHMASVQQILASRTRIYKRQYKTELTIMWLKTK